MVNTPCILLVHYSVQAQWTYFHLRGQRIGGWVVQDPSGSHIWCQSQYPTTSSIPRLSSYSMHWRPSNAQCINPPGARLHWISSLTYSTLLLLTAQLKSNFADVFFLSPKTSRGAMRIRDLRKLKKPNNTIKLRCFCDLLWVIHYDDLWHFNFLVIGFSPLLLCVNGLYPAVR